MSEIRSQILKEVGKLDLVPMSIEKPLFHERSLVSFLSLKEVKKIPHEDKDGLFTWKPSVLFPEYEEFYQGLADDVTSEKDYSKLKDGTNVVELFAIANRLRVTADYLRYIKASTNGFIVNIYDGNISLKSLRSLRSKRLLDLPKTEKKLRRDKKDEERPNYEFTKPGAVNYTILGGKTYWDDIMIETCRDPVATLAIDLPYRYFSTQNLRGNIFTWDINKKVYEVCGKKIAEIDKLIEKVAAKGFQEPLVFRINEGCLTPVDDETAINLFIATYLDLPSIPTILFMSNEDQVKNRVYEELYEIANSNFWRNRPAIAMVNSIVRPYFYFEFFGENEGKEFFTVDGYNYHLNQYPPMTDTSDSSIIVHDRFLNKSAKEEEIHFPMNEEEIQKKIDETNQQLLDELDKKLKLEHAEISKRILAGEFDNV